ncbi:MAG: Isoprenyl transferase [Candidatus Anoxychlamydiales bacterium]|nr:Isoprenyl transferase [Candidatus Anoxychlamydiales bacterium]
MKKKKIFSFFSVLIPFVQLFAFFESEDKKDLLDYENIPNHIAIIMDGNRRWAKENNVSIEYGYRKGAEVLLDTIKSCIDLGVNVLTVYTFSTENWNRSKEELDTLFNLFDYMCRSQKNSLIELGVSLHAIGDITKFPKSIIDLIEDTKKATQNCKKLDLILAINYGGRDELRRAIIKLIDDVENLKIRKENISEDVISLYLDTYGFADPDLLIRTASEARLSNFLLWQVAYTEIYIENMYWPDFKKENLIVAILDYQKRIKRKGT